MKTEGTKAVRLGTAGEHGSLADWLLTIGRNCAARLKEPFRSIDHGLLLYDEQGLPQRSSDVEMVSP